METASAPPPAPPTRVLTSTHWDNFERSMVDFVIRWCHFGGGSPQDIFQEFGLFEADFFRRVLRLTKDTGNADGADLFLRDQVRRVCRHRLQQQQPIMPAAGFHLGRVGWGGPQPDISGG